jgi:hypothetical protein
VIEREAVDDRNNRDKINRARQAAEDLFKPAERTTPAELLHGASDAASPAGQQHRRQPRIFTIPPRAPVSAPDETPDRPKRIPRKAAPRRETVSVPPSQEGRVRALTSYGMTRAQVAELYGVTVEEIERIVRRPVPSGRSG